MLVNLKDLSCPPLLVTITTLATRFLKGVPVCEFWMLNFNWVGVSIIGVCGKYVNWTLTLFSRSTHNWVPLPELVCPKAGLFEYKITVAIITNVATTNNDTNEIEEEYTEIRKLIIVNATTIICLKTFISLNLKTLIPLNLKTLIPLNLKTLIPLNLKTLIPLNLKTLIPLNLKTLIPV